MTNRIWTVVCAVLAATTLVAVLQGTGGAGVRFPHRPHIEAGADCATCHPAAEESRAGEDLLLPEMEICGQCHEEDDLAYYGWSRPEAAASGFPRFSHEAHLALDGIDCLACHGSLADPELAGTGKGEIGHDLCGSCHDGETAASECESCHADLRLLRPRDHKADYLHTHQFQARASAGACESCHRDSDLCSDCHQGENVLFRTHDRNYLLTHPMDARKHEHDCASCHDLRSFCNDCHAAERVKPSNHRSGWLTGENRHAIEARRDIAYCAACHDDEDPVCTRCHGPR